MRYLVKRTVTFGKGTDRERTIINYFGTHDEIVANNSTKRPKPLTREVIEKRAYKTREWAEKNWHYINEAHYGTSEIVEFEI